MMANGDGNEIMQAPLEQNQRLLDLVERKPETFYVMPDLNKAIHDFDGEGSSHEAGVWLKSIDSMAVLHGWPVSFRLENARLHMKMKPSKEPLRVKETMVLPKRTVCWVTGETVGSQLAVGCNAPDLILVF
ncbi:hypothetical protein HPB47_005645 [Ixodes persulcatus]|uniref:Uncharacterized protein n=1 Tax=Ixodes persulcatus TaxID=34615 RepID=A0AC60PD05_IXOPE|nr:hypothetical protein HPB47_005645 [Ixodes persulcatus]